jgi:endonuclease/exonuclease/phosphatase family metal-dependent hydrolase
VHHAEPDAAPRFDGVLALDLDGDGEIDLHRFSKPPLEAEVTVDGRHVFRLIAVHAKSKAPRGAESRAEAALVSLINRRKQLAQCAWLRARIDGHLKVGEDLVTLGDFNDGPGLDRYERVFGRSGVEVVMGDPDLPEMRMHTPFARPVVPSQPRPSTARFYKNGRFQNALIDFVMVSPGLVARVAPSWRIWHPFDDVECFEDQTMKAALLDASDHFPVTVDLALP